jgi:hypothetical protein
MTDAHVVLSKQLLKPWLERARLLFGSFAGLALAPATDDTRQTRARRAALCLVCGRHSRFQMGGAVIFPEQLELERLVFAPELEKAGVEEDLGHDREPFDTIHAKPRVWFSNRSKFQFQFFIFSF